MSKPLLIKEILALLEPSKFTPAPDVTWYSIPDSQIWTFDNKIITDICVETLGSDSSIIMTLSGGPQEFTQNIEFSIESSRLKIYTTQPTLFNHILAGCKAQQKPRTGYNIFTYLVEELGEISTEINIANRYSNKAPGIDGIIGECVDVMLCVIDLIRHYYPDATEQQLIEIATAKLAKWK